MGFSIEFCVVMSIGVLALAREAEGGVLFSSLNRTLTVTSQIEEINTGASRGTSARVGVDQLVVRWSLDSSFPAGIDVKYAKIITRLCFAPVSQVDRGWRKTKDDLHKDKTCSAAVIASQNYTADGNSTVWRIPKNLPRATYFVRTYAIDANGAQQAFGQTTNKAKSVNLFVIAPITGRHPTIDVAAAIFSVFAVGSLVFFLSFETLLSRKRAAAAA